MVIRRRSIFPLRAGLRQGRSALGFCQSTSGPDGVCVRCSSCIRPSPNRGVSSPCNQAAGAWAHSACTTGFKTRRGGSSEGRVMTRVALARSPVQYVAEPAKPERQPQFDATAAETLALALERLNQSLELEVAVLRVQRDIERVLAVADLWKLAS